MGSVPTEQWAQVVAKIGGPVEYKKIPVEKPGPDEVLVNIKYSGVCHTDLHAVNGDWPIPPKMPLVGGHEGAGVVVAKGDLVSDVEIGDYAGVKVCSSLLLPSRPKPPFAHALCSGSTDLAWPVISASNHTSPSAPRLFSPDTP